MPGFIASVGALAAALGIGGVLGVPAVADADTGRPGGGDSSDIRTERGHGKGQSAGHARHTGPARPIAPKPTSSKQAAADPVEPVISEPRTSLPSETATPLIATAAEPPAARVTPTASSTAPVPASAKATVAPAIGLLDAVPTPLSGGPGGAPLESPTSWVALAVARRFGRQRQVLSSAAVLNPTLSITNSAVTEGNSGTKTLTFTVSLSQAAAGTVKVGYTTANGTATAGQDYTAKSGTLTFAPGVTSQTVTVTVTGDTSFEPNETFAVRLSAPTGATLGTATATGTITNDDPAPPVTTKITWAWGSNTVLKFNPAIDKLDFGYFSPDNFDIAEVSGAVRVTIVGNSQTYTLSGVRLDQMNTANIIAQDSATITKWRDAITTAKQTVKVSVANAAVAEGNSGTAALVFTVSLARSFDKTVTVNYTTSNGTAAAGQDYTAKSGTLTFAPGVTAQQVTIAVSGDVAVEYDETVAVTLSTPTGGAVLATRTAAGVIANDDTISGLPLATSQTGKVIAAYFPDYAIWAPNFQIADVPAGQLTHLFYAFLDVTPSGGVAFGDSYAALDHRFGAGETVNGQADQWYYPPEDPRSKQTVWGNMNQLVELKQKYPKLHINISIGGSTLSGNFSTVTATAAGREKLANSIVSFMTTYKTFDGVDFDWEFPGGGGADTNSVSPNDGANYAALLKLVRTKLDALGTKTGKRYEITVASPATADQLATFNLAGLAPSVDFFNVMTYEFHGTWDMTTGHQSAFTADPAGRDVRTAVEAHLAAGVAPAKIVLGAPAYTIGWSGVADGGDGGYQGVGTGEAPGTFSPGMYDYKDLLAQLKNPIGGWKLYWDDRAQAPYLYNGTKKLFSTFETPTSIAQKSQWAQTLGLRGMMFWDVSSDAVGTADSLVKAAYSSWVLHQNLATIRAQSTLKGEVTIGGDGVIKVLPPRVPVRLV